MDTLEDLDSINKKKNTNWVKKMGHSSVATANINLDNVSKQICLATLWSKCNGLVA